MNFRGSLLQYLADLRVRLEKKKNVKMEEISIEIYMDLILLTSGGPG